MLEGEVDACLPIAGLQDSPFVTRKELARRAARLFVILDEQNCGHE
jgi:hypothetical protein